jgi:phosphoserine aminotransferase
VTERAWNFSTGPGALPMAVLQSLRDEIVELPGAGASISNAMPVWGVQAQRTSLSGSGG